ncbi:MAG TPA: sulfatase [Planctomycetota bacterium]|nr:sulfatase [Planctomycetota bacterium]
MFPPVLAALAVLATLQLAAPDDPPAREPRDGDVILIVVDTLRADHVGCYGYHRPATPGIDAIAARGVRFAKAFAQSSWTGPSMVSLFLSRHVLTDFMRMPEGQALAERLRAAGYRTVAFQYNPLLAPGQGFERGFDSYEMLADPGRYREVLGAPDGRPLFAYFHFIDPHDPYSPQPLFDVFAPELDADLRARVLAYLRAVQPDSPETDLQFRASQAADRAAEIVARYDGDVLQADSRVQMVVQALGETGRLGRSLLILTSDHGECLGDHHQSPSAPRDKEPDNPLWWFKMTHGDLVTEELLHVPLILAGPGLPWGAVVEQPVELVDLLPTILDLSGLELPAGLDGRSLRREIGGAAAGREFTYASTWLLSSVRARDGRKLVLPWEAGGADPARAYRLASDPRERQPLPPDDPAFADLRAAMDAFRARGLRARPEDVLVDEETRRRLDELGYVGR